MWGKKYVSGVQCVFPSAKMLTMRRSSPMRKWPCITNQPIGRGRLHWLVQQAVDRQSLGRDCWTTNQIASLELCLVRSHAFSSTQSYVSRVTISRALSIFLSPCVQTPPGAVGKVSRAAKITTLSLVRRLRLSRLQVRRHMHFLGCFQMRNDLAVITVHVQPNIFQVVTEVQLWVWNKRKKDSWHLQICCFCLQGSW